MQKRSLKSVFFPKIGSPVIEQQLSIKKQQILKSLEQQQIRNQFFYRSQNNKTTQQKKHKNRNQIKIVHRSAHNCSQIGNEETIRDCNFQRKQQRYHLHSESLPLSVKMKSSIGKRGKKSRRRLNNQILNTQPQEEMRRHFCYSIPEEQPHRLHKDKRKLAKIKTECHQEYYQIALKKQNPHIRITDLLKVKRAAQFEYSIPDNELKKERQNRIIECLNSLKKMKKHTQKVMQITSIKGWNAQLEATCQFFI